MPRLTLVGGALLGYGAIIAVGDAMSQLTTWQMVFGHADRAQMAALLDRTSNASGASLFFGPGGLAFLVGSILLTVALVRTRVVPVWVSIAFLLGIVVQLVGFTSSSVAVIAASAVICLVAMAMWRVGCGPARETSPEPPSASASSSRRSDIGAERNCCAPTVHAWHHDRGQTA